MQVSPSGMAAASQAASGEFDSRHLLHCLKHLIDFRCFYLQIQLFAKSLSLFAFSRNG